MHLVFFGGPRMKKALLDEQLAFDKNTNNKCMKGKGKFRTKY